MELSCVASTYLSSNGGLRFCIRETRWRKGIGRARVRASAEDNAADRRNIEIAAGAGQMMELSTSSSIERSLDADFPVWDKIGAVVRLSYGIGIYGAMAVAGKVICSVAGIDCTGGFDPSLEAVVQALGYAAPPIMALLFILDV